MYVYKETGFVQNQKSNDLFPKSLGRKGQKKKKNEKRADLRVIKTR